MSSSEASGARRNVLRDSEQRGTRLLTMPLPKLCRVTERISRSSMVMLPRSHQNRGNKAQVSNLPTRRSATVSDIAGGEYHEHQVRLECLAEFNL